jgi:Dyp-type peroxidase family
MARERLIPEEMADIQGLVLRAYRHARSSLYFLLEVVDPSAAKRWLADVEVEHAGERDKVEVRATAWRLNVALTYEGLTALRLHPHILETFPRDFREGMHRGRRPDALGDPPAADWEYGGDGALHVLVMLFCRDQEVRDARGPALEQELRDAGFRVIAAETCELGDKEHFGFADGFSQPLIKGDYRAKSDGGDDDEVSLAAGEFVLGYLNAYGKPPVSPSVPAHHPHADVLPDHGLAGRRDLGRNGTFLVLRKIEQDVAGFWSYFRREAQTALGDPARAEWLAAKCMGRWPSGASLVQAPERDDPDLGKDLERRNAFAFRRDGDLRGTRCPIGAHIRRCNPRDSLADDSARGTELSDRHRIIRRGRTYGTPHADPRRAVRGDEPATARGILFVAINANITRQFEFVQKTWVVSPKFGDAFDDPDPVAGHKSGADGGHFSMPRDPYRKRLNGLHAFTTMRGGAYFFAPGLRALRFIGRAPQVDPDEAEAPPPPVIEPIGPVDPDLETVPAGEAEAIGEIARMMGAAHERRYRYVRPALRDAHAKQHACLRAELHVGADVPPPLRHGVFAAPAVYQAWVRLSNASDSVAPDRGRDARGLAIKLLGVEGPKFLRDETHTQDFLLVNAPAFFVRDAADYVELVRAQQAGSILRFFAGLRPPRLRLDELRNAVASLRAPVHPLADRYFSMTPYKLGPHAIKFSVRPRGAVDASLDRRDDDCLRDAVRAHLSAGDAALSFCVQLRRDGLPIEDASAEWSEREAPFVEVATLRLPAQEFDTPERDAFGEALSFNPWHSIAAHAPLGGINRVRRAIYPLIAWRRRTFNRVPLEEPGGERSSPSVRELRRQEV